MPEPLRMTTKGRAFGDTGAPAGAVALVWWSPACDRPEERHGAHHRTRRRWSTVSRITGPWAGASSRG